VLGLLAVETTLDRFPRLKGTVSQITRHINAFRHNVACSVVDPHFFVNADPYTDPAFCC
jgi:hypothetical protein